MFEKIIYGLMGGVAAFFAPLPLLIFWIFIFVIADMITGMLAAKQRGELLTSKKLKRTLSKLICYMTIILLARGIKVHVLPMVELYACYITSRIFCF